MAGNKLTHVEISKRVDACLHLRYNCNPPILAKEWVQYCHENYGDKSEKQYWYYWTLAREKYEENWRAKLGKLLEPAMNELKILLEDDDPKIRQRAIDQIMRYSGNDIEKIETKLESNITLSWGDESNEKEK